MIKIENEIEKLEKYKKIIYDVFSNKKIPSKIYIFNSSENKNNINDIEIILNYKNKTKIKNEIIKVYIDLNKYEIENLENSYIFFKFKENNEKENLNIFFKRENKQTNVVKKQIINKDYKYIYANNELFFYKISRNLKNYIIYKCLDCFLIYDKENDLYEVDKNIKEALNNLKIKISIKNNIDFNKLTVYEYNKIMNFLKKNLRDCKENNYENLRFLNSKFNTNDNIISLSSSETSKIFFTPLNFFSKYSDYIDYPVYDLEIISCPQKFIDELFSILTEIKKSSNISKEELQEKINNLKNSYFNFLNFDESNEPIKKEDKKEIFLNTLISYFIFNRKEILENFDTNFLRNYFEVLFSFLSFFEEEENNKSFIINKIKQIETFLFNDLSYLKFSINNYNEKDEKIKEFFEEIKTIKRKINLFVL